MFIKPVVQALGLEAIEIEIGGPLELDDLRALYRLVHSPVFPNVPLFARLVKKAGMSGLPAVLTGMGGDHLLDGHPISIVDLLGSGRWRHGLSLAQKLWMNDEVWSPRLARHVFRGVCRRVRSAGDVKRNRERSEPGARPSLGFEGMTILSSIERESRLFHLDAQAELSESFGVEVRDPLFDRDLIDFVLLLDPGLLMLGGYRRGLVRSCLGKLLPKGVATREGKTDLSDVSAPVWEQWYETRQSQRANLSCWTRLVDFDRAIGSYRPGFVRDVATLEVFAETKFTGVK
jgi:asparagine synthetase B (glutamine-hydrolysing)